MLTHFNISVIELAIDKHVRLSKSIYSAAGNQWGVNQGTTKQPTGIRNYPRKARLCTDAGTLGTEGRNEQSRAVNLNIQIYLNRHVLRALGGFPGLRRGPPSGGLTAFPPKDCQRSLSLFGPDLVPVSNA